MNNHQAHVDKLGMAPGKVPSSHWNWWDWTEKNLGVGVCPLPAGHLSILPSQILFTVTCSFFFHINQTQDVPSGRVQSKPKPSQGVGSEDFGFWRPGNGSSRNTSSRAGAEQWLQAFWTKGECQSSKPPLGQSCIIDFFFFFFLKMVFNMGQVIDGTSFNSVLKISVKNTGWEYFP